MPPEEKARIKKAVQILVQGELLVLTESSLSDEENYEYELLPAEQQRWIDQTTERGARQFREATQEMVDLDLLHQWQTLDPEEKKQLQHQFATRYFAQATASDQSPDALQHLYEQLSPEEQSQINQLAHTLIFSTKSSDSLSFGEDSFQLEKYSPEEQRAIAQLVVYRATQMKKRYATEVNTDTFQWEKLPSEAKNSISRTARYRQFTAQSSTDISLREESIQSINLYAILQSNPEVFTIKGKVKNLLSKNDTVTLSFGTANQKVSTTLQPDGSFIFRKVSYQGSPQLSVEPSSSSIPALLTLSLEELELVVEEDSQFVASFDNIYFETNKHDLTPEALPALERAVQFHRQHPDVTIQIHAYADSVGSETFNYELSQQRGEAVYQYMMAQGVDTNAIEIVPKGKENLDPSQTLSYSRRVEFVIAGSNTKYNPTRKIYLLSASPHLEEIASRYQVSLKELVAQNPGLPSPIPSYTIIKLVTNRIINDN
ncbi:MAG: OmpA family protein [Cyclobacteriaceae bacterium]